MRIGSISQGKLKCEVCGENIAYAERYLIVKETRGVEDEEKGEPRRYCVKCATEKGYASLRVEKGDRVITFFQDMINPIIPTPEEGETAETEGKEEKQDA